jgi:hypothetical protein
LGGETSAAAPSPFHSSIIALLGDRLFITIDAEEARRWVEKWGGVGG